MKKLMSVCLALVMLISASFVSAYAVSSTDYTIVNPYENVDWANWKTYKANLHTHSTASDGRVPLSEMVELYYKAGYDILAMTDHGVINTGWKDERKTHGVFNGFKKVSPMSEEDYERMTKGLDRDGRGITDITGGIECNMAVISKTHVNGYFTTYGNGVWGKENDYKTAPAKIEEAGGYSVLNHVGDWVNSNNFPDRAHKDIFITYFADIFTTYKTCLGMEIMNNTDNVSRADRALWDELLQVVIPTGRNIWVFADDDSEFPDEVGRSFEFFPLAENNEENVKQAMINGSFFASSKFDKSDRNNEFVGSPDVEAPIVTNLEVNQKENTLSVNATNCDDIQWIANGKVIATGNSIDLNDYEDELGCYIRFRLKGEGGVTYSQAFELKYDGRVDKEIPASPIPNNFIGNIFRKLYQTIPVALFATIIEKIGLWTGIIPKK